MSTTYDSADFSDRPWMEGEPATESKARRPKDPALSKALAWRAACHGAPVLSWILPVLGLGIMAPLLIWQVKAKQDDDTLLAAEAVEALNFQINVAALSFLLSATIIGLAIVPIVWIVGTVFAIIATVKTHRGEEYRYPRIFRPITLD
jgi:uncharacterized protein